MKSPNCPVCTSYNIERVYPTYTGSCITSDSKIYPQGVIENHICCECGLIFNAAGTRGATEDFYRDSYNLMTQSSNAAIQSFEGPETKSQAEKTLDVLMRLFRVPEFGCVLEAGAGKGDFLRYFLRQFASWNAKAFEPSRSYEYLRESLPKVDSRQCEYQDYHVGEKSADLVVSLGVLEHVENPYDMLVWINSQLSSYGHVFLRVPNFANNPNDLFCVDHLSKLTVSSITNLAERAGFEIIDVDDRGVPLYVLLVKRGPPSGNSSSAYNDNKTILARNVNVAEAIIRSVLECRKQANERGEPWAVFGMGAAGLFAPYFDNFDPSEIAAYLDENQTVWGGEAHGRPVGGLDMIADMGIKHVVLSVSPIYFSQIRSKLEPHGVNVYTALGI